MISFRDAGKALARLVPSFEGQIRNLYNILPDSFHDTPTKRLSTLFSQDSAVAFVQIGAHDGVAGDAIRPIILKSNHWFGVLVEPQPVQFKKLLANYALYKDRLSFLNVAISNVSGIRRLYFVSDEYIAKSGLPNWATEIASFDPKHITKHFPEAELSCIDVPTLSFEEAISCLPDRRVDAIIVDVEGHEYAILHNIDFDRHRVRFIMFEHKHMSIEDKSAVAELLRQYRFDLKEFGRDTVAWRGLSAPV